MKTSALSVKNLPTFASFGGSGEAEFIILKSQEHLRTEPKLVINLYLTPATPANSCPTPSDERFLLLCSRPFVTTDVRFLMEADGDFGDHQTNSKWKVENTVCLF